MAVDTVNNIMDILPDVLNEIAKSKEKQREIDEILATNYNIPRGTFHELLVNNERFEHLTDEEKIVLTVVIHDISNDDRIDPKQFYSQKELKSASKYQHEDESVVALPYTFTNVLAMPTGRDFVTIVSYQELAALWNSKVITYNFATQRLSKKKQNKKGKIIEKADVNLRSVKNITRLMLERKYKPDTLLLNILVDGKDDVSYGDGELTIGEGTSLNLIDGMHRMQGILNVIEQEPDYEGFVQITIKHYPLEDAQFLLGQTNTINRFDKTLVKHYMGETIGAQITKDLMNIPELKNRISIKTTLDKKLNYFTNFAILSEAIESIFEPQNNKDRYDFTEVLKKFFGYLVAAFENEFIKNKNEVSKTSWLVHHNIWVGFVVIAKKLYDKHGKDFPVDEIVRIVKGINLSKEKSEFNDLMTSQGKVNSNRVKAQIRKFFEDKVDELLA